MPSPNRPELTPSQQKRHDQHGVCKQATKMNVVRSIAIVIVVAIGAALMVASVGAQSPSAAPTAKIARFIVSEKPPQYWTAEGGTQAGWMALRQRCADIGAELTRRQSMSDKQLGASPGLSFSRDEMLLCSRLPTGNKASGPLVAPSTPAPTINTRGIPEQAPQWFIAEGSTQGKWTAIREDCDRKVAEATRRGQLSAAQRRALPPFKFTHQDLMLCAHLSASPSEVARTSPAPAPAGVSPTPISTPLPPALPLAPRSLAPDSK